MGTKGVSHRAGTLQAPVIPVVADWIRANPGTLSLGQGVVGYGPPPEAAVEAARVHEEPGLHRYQAVDGLPELVEALRVRLALEHGIRAAGPGGDGDLPRIVVSAGSNAAFLEIILAICDAGDEVILPTPYFFNQEMALGLAGVRVVTVPCGPGYQLDVDRIVSAIGPRTRAVVTISPNNPSGAVYPAGVLREVNRVCGERGIYHVSDEAYAAFVHGAEPAVSPGAFAGASGHTISLFSFSKGFGFASWRIGYAVVPPWLHEPLRKIQDTNLICPPVVSQLAALGCLKAGPGWVRERVAGVRATRTVVLEGLAALGDRVEVGPADGAFYVLLKLRSGADPMEVARRLIEEHRVAVIPGTAFGFGPGEGSHVRVAYGALTPETAADGIGRLVAGLKRLG